MKCCVGRNDKDAAPMVAIGDISEFEDMNESDLRYHKYAELCEAWKQTHNNKLATAKSYALQEVAREWARTVVCERARIIERNA
jgi:hypothetical protein